MIKRHLIVAAILAVAACSGKLAPTDDAGASGSSSSSSGASGKPHPSTSSSTSTSSSSGSSGSCPDTTPIDPAQDPWEPPRVLLGTCTDKEIASLDAYITANPGSSDADWKAGAGLSGACVACVFGEDGATWPPIVEAGGSFALLNVGGCIALASGQPACGQAFQAWNDCRYEACAGCSDPQFNQCLTKASQTACKQANDAVITKCGAAITDYENTCQGTATVLDGPIRAQCGAGVGPGKDGG